MLTPRALWHWPHSGRFGPCVVKLKFFSPGVACKAGGSRNGVFEWVRVCVRECVINFCRPLIGQQDRVVNSSGSKMVNFHRTEAGLT